MCTVPSPASEKEMMQIMPLRRKWVPEHTRTRIRSIRRSPTPAEFTETTAVHRKSGNIYACGERTAPRKQSTRAPRISSNPAARLLPNSQKPQLGTNQIRLYIGICMRRKDSLEKTHTPPGWRTGRCLGTGSSPACVSSHRHNPRPPPADKKSGAQESELCA